MYKYEQVKQLYDWGHTREEIAREMDMEVNTVNHHLRRRYGIYADGSDTPKVNNRSLSDELVREIRELRSGGAGCRDIAHMYDIDHVLVWRVTTGRSYKDVI